MRFKTDPQVAGLKSEIEQLLLDSTQKEDKIKSLSAAVETLQELVQQLLTAQNNPEPVSMIVEASMPEESSMIVHQKSNKKRSVVHQPMTSLAIASAQQPVQAQKKPKSVSALDLEKSDPAFNRFSVLSWDDEKFLMEPDNSQVTDRMLEDDRFSDAEPELGQEVIDSAPMDQSEVESATERIQALNIRGDPDSRKQTGTGSAL